MIIRFMYQMAEQQYYYQNEMFDEEQDEGVGYLGDVLGMMIDRVTYMLGRLVRNNIDEAKEVSILNFVHIDLTQNTCTKIQNVH